MSTVNCFWVLAETRSSSGYSLFGVVVVALSTAALALGFDWVWRLSWLLAISAVTFVLCGSTSDARAVTASGFKHPSLPRRSSGDRLPACQVRRQCSLVDVPGVAFAPGQILGCGLRAEPEAVHEPDSHRP